MSQAKLSDMNTSETDFKVITTSCPHDCGGMCLLQAHVQNGKIDRITTVANPELRACIRGLSYADRVYSDERLKYPLRRVGERGEGRFERISWIEALDTVAAELKLIKVKYGNSAFLVFGGAGNAGRLHNTSSFCNRFFNMFGGKIEYWSIASNEGCCFASRIMLGAKEGPFGDLFPSDAHEPDDFPNSRLIILWGFNPVYTIQGTGTYWYLTQAKKKGCRIVSLDPVYNDTARNLDARWISIRPCTDTAMMAAMAYTMVTENLQDQKFLDKYTVGFEIFKDYILGVKDRIPKSPEWAEKITGVPAEEIVELAKTYAEMKPAALIHGWGPGRTAFGEEFHRMAITLEAMTGNIGIHGGSTGNTWGYPIRMGEVPVEENPVGSIKADEWADCILQGKSGGFPGDVKLLYVVGGNILNQLENTNKGIKALKILEFVVVHEQFMTPTARFADILLPVTTGFEYNDIKIPWVRGHYAIFTNKVIEPMHECKSDLEIFTELAEMLGVSGFNPYTEDEWLRNIVKESDIPDYEEFKRKGFWKFELPEPWVAFKKQIEDPENNPFSTPSGKIEIYSKTLANMNFEKSKYGSPIPPIPQYRDGWENLNDPLVKKYPLQLITPHHIYRIHSTHYNTKSLRQLYSHEALINPEDAKARNITDGDPIRILNERGEIKIKAKVTERIMPGVVAVYEGTYYNPDEKGIDRGGCSNILTKDKPSPAGAFPYNQALVEIRKENT